MTDENKKRLDSIEEDLKTIEEFSQYSDTDALIRKAEVNLMYLIVCELDNLSQQIYEINHFGLGDF